MPRTLARQVKYKCCDLACGKKIRSDKWNAHCKSDHGSKLARGHEIAKKIIEIKEGDGPWRPFCEPGVDTANRCVPNKQDTQLTSIGSSQCVQTDQTTPCVVVNPDPAISDSAYNADIGHIAMQSIYSGGTTGIKSVSNDDHGLADSAEAEALAADSVTAAVTSITSVTPVSEAIAGNAVDSITAKVTELRLISDNRGIDPALYAHKKLMASDINKCLTEGTFQPHVNFVFPQSNGRSFQPDWLYKVIPHDSFKHRRNWLSYSVSSDRAFCLTCILFGGSLASRTWAYDGWCDWRNGLRVIEQHETNKEHKAAEIARFHWLSGRSLMQITLKPSNSIIAENRKVVSCIVDCLKYLSQEMMALRGHDSSAGKLMNLFRLISKYNPPAAAYLERFDRRDDEDGTKMATNFLSPRNVRRLLTVMKQMVVGEVVQRLQPHRKCSIIADGTYDSSKQEATVLLLRYIEIEKNGLLKPVERLIDVFCAGDTSGSQLCNQIISSLNDCGISVEWLVGQGYDGAGNVRGKCQGLKTRIQQLNSKAVYVWCYGHRFNLVIEATSSCCTETKNALGLLEELYVFFSGHKRNSIFTVAQSESDEHRRLQLKRVCSTRWSSKEAAIETVIRCFAAILTSLDQLASDTDSDSATKTGARGLAIRLSDIRFIITLFSLREVFTAAGPVSRQLQGVSMDLAAASQLVTVCREKFLTMRNDQNINNVWETILQKSRTFATEHGLLWSITERRKVKKLMAGEVVRDETPVGEERLRVCMFVPMLDALCTQMTDRFGDDQARLLQEMSLFSSANVTRGYAIQPEDIPILTKTYSLNSEQVVAEFADFCVAFKTLSRSTEVDTETAVAEPTGTDDSSAADSEPDENDDPAERLYDQKTRHSFSEPLSILYQLSGYEHLLRLYWTLVTLPVTSCSAERALSRLKIIKNRLRSTMSDEWMSDLMVLAAEKDIVSSISCDAIIDSFASLSDHLKRRLLFV